MSSASVDSTAEGRTRRIVVFVGAKVDDAGIEAIEKLVTSMPHARILVVEAATKRLRGRAAWRAALERLRREPLSWPLEVGCGLARLLLVPGRADAVSTRIEPASLDALPHVWQAAFDDIETSACQEAISKFAPWLGISLGTTHIPRVVAALPELGTIHVHKSYLPEYRGGPPGFWELHDGALETGVSVHWLDERRDKGDILVQRRLDVPPYATPRGLELLLEDLACELVTEAVQSLDEETATRKPQLVPSTPTRDRPPFLLRRRVERACLQRRRAAQVHRASGLREACKQAVLFLWVHGYCMLRNFFRGARGQQHTAILVFHRVSDTFTDTITTGVEQFTKLLELAKRHYDVLDMAEWLRDRGKPRRRPAVVFAFDDGYADNYFAAKLLRRAGVPCTFFVCTGIVGTDDPFLHDLERIGVRVPALTWDQCRDMAARGFHFASHSVYHTDFGTSGSDAAIDEIEAAGRHLRKHLGLEARDHWLAHPFGFAHNMTAEVRQRLERAGVEVLFASNGGTNSPSFSLDNVRRIPVSSAISNTAFCALVEGWKMDLGPGR